MTIPILFSARNRPLINWAFLGGSLPGGMIFTRASSGTRVNAAGVIETLSNNHPRFDYDPVTLQPRGLLLEEQRTNNTFPSVIDAAGTGWTRTNATLGDVITAPDGTATMRQIIDNGTTLWHGLTGNNIWFTSGVAVTESFYAKAGTESVVQQVFNSSVFPTNPYANFDLVNGVLGTVSGCTATITHVGNGVYRCTCTATPTTSGTGKSIIVAFANNNAAADRIPPYSGTGKYFYLWGVQNETAGFASSYIPTSGAAATRALDALTTTNIPWFNATQGTMLTELDLGGRSPSVPIFSSNFNDGGVDNYIGTYSIVEFIPRGIINACGIIRHSEDGAVLTENVPFKHALSYRAGANKSAIGGVVLGGGTLLASPLPTGIVRLTLGNKADGARPMTGHLRGFKYWNRAFSDAELQRITT